MAADAVVVRLDVADAVDFGRFFCGRAGLTCAV
jgi:hypothetical protein